MIRRLSLLPVPGLIFVIVICLMWPKPVADHHVPLGRLIVPKGDLIGQTYTNRCIYLNADRSKLTKIVIKECTLYDCVDTGIWIDAATNKISVEVSECVISGFDGWRLGTPNGTIQIR